MAKPDQISATTRIPANESQDNGVELDEGQCSRMLVCPTDTSPTLNQYRIASASTTVDSSRSGRPKTNTAMKSSPNSFSRSPLRSSSTHHSSTTQKLRTPSFSGTTGHGSHRRLSISSVGDTSDFSSSIGMPYTYSINAHYTSGMGAMGSSSLSNSSRTAYVMASGRNTNSTKSSPRSSFATSLDYTNPSPNLSASRRHSDYLLSKPSTTEVFDLMEREQDAIVLKLIKEISQLKEDNRALVNTINKLTSTHHKSRNFTSAVYSDSESVEPRST